MPFVKGGFGLFRIDHSEQGWSIFSEELTLIDQLGLPEIYVVKEDALFAEVFRFFLAGLGHLLLSPDQALIAVQALRGQAVCVRSGIFKEFSFPKKYSSDSVPASLADYDFVEEQYRYSREIQDYGLEHINLGEKMQFPLADFYRNLRNQRSSGHSRNRFPYSRFLGCFHLPPQLVDLHRSRVASRKLLE